MALPPPAPVEPQPKPPISGTELKGDDETKNDKSLMHNGGFGGYPSIYESCDDEDLKYDNSRSQWSKSLYTKIYNALKDLEECNVKLSVPEFVFIGFQSSGKTSAVVNVGCVKVINPFDIATDRLFVVSQNSAIDSILVVGDIEHNSFRI